MFAPNISTHQLADQIHQERLSHSALMQKVARERSADSVSVDRETRRRATVRRLAASLGAVTLLLSIAAAATATQPSETTSTHPAAQGGGAKLIR